MDKLTALRVFRRVAERNSFSAAADDLALSRAAVSKNVRELEAELGVRLINRTTRRLHLTEAGELYLARTSAVLDDLTQADAAASELSLTPRGRLKVSAPMSLGLTKIGRAVSEFLIACPEVKVELDLNDRFIDLVDGGFDVGIRGAGQLEDSSLIARRLCDLNSLACASPSYLARRGAPAAPEDLADHDCLTYSLASERGQWVFTRGEESRSVQVDGPLRANNSLAIVQAAAAGLGVVVAPIFALEAGLASGALVQVLPEWRATAGAVYAIYPRHRQASLTVRAFVDTAARVLG